MIVTYIYPSAENDHQRVQLRCKNLSDAIRRTGQHQSFLLDLDSFLNMTEEAQELCSRSDILVIYKHLYGRALRMVQFWKARDKRVLVDFDEALNLIPPDFEEYQFWMSDNLSPHCNDFLGGARTQATPLEQFRWGLRQVDSATVPSIHLAENWSDLTRVRQIPNYLNINHYPSQSETSRAGGKLTIGIQCQSISAKGLVATGLLPAIQEVVRLYPHVHFQIFSLAESSFSLPAIDASRITLMPRIPYPAWPAVLAKVDIGVAVVNDAYGMTSSPFSLTEFMILRIPWLASDLPPYRALNQYGWLIPNSKENWKHSLIEVIDCLKSYRKAASGGPFLYALGQDVSANISTVLDFYQSIL